MDSEVGKICLDEPQSNYEEISDERITSIDSAAILAFHDTGKQSQTPAISSQPSDTAHESGDNSDVTSERETYEVIPLSSDHDDGIYSRSLSAPPSAPANKDKVKKPTPFALAMAGNDSTIQKALSTLKHNSDCALIPERLGSTGVEDEVDGSMSRISTPIIEPPPTPGAHSEDITVFGKKLSLDSHVFSRPPAPLPKPAGHQRAKSFDLAAIRGPHDVEELDYSLPQGRRPPSHAPRLDEDVRENDEKEDNDHVYEDFASQMIASNDKTPPKVPCLPVVSPTGGRGEIEKQESAVYSQLLSRGQMETVDVEHLMNYEGVDWNWFPQLSLEKGDKLSHKGDKLSDKSDASKKEDSSSETNDTSSEKNDSSSEKNDTSSEKDTQSKKNDTSSKQDDIQSKKDDTSSEEDDTLSKKDDTSSEKDDTWSKKDDTWSNKSNTSQEDTAAGMTSKGLKEHVTSRTGGNSDRKSRDAKDDGRQNTDLPTESTKDVVGTLRGNTDYENTVDEGKLPQAPVKDSASTDTRISLDAISDHALPDYPPETGHGLLEPATAEQLDNYEDVNWICPDMIHDSHEQPRDTSRVLVTELGVATGRRDETDPKKPHTVFLHADIKHGLAYGQTPLHAVDEDDEDDDYEEIASPGPEFKQFDLAVEGAQESCAKQKSCEELGVDAGRDTAQEESESGTRQEYGERFELSSFATDTSDTEIYSLATHTSG